METIDDKCGHIEITPIGMTDEETTNDYFKGVVHYYLNCNNPDCQTTLLRNAEIFNNYQFVGMRKDEPIYHKKNYNI